MAEIAHAFTEQNAAQTTTSASYVDVSDASIAASNFTVGKKYLLKITAQMRNNTANTTNGVRTLHGTTAFAESEVLGFRANPFAQVYQFSMLWTAVSGEAIKLQFKTASGTFELDAIALHSMALSDDLTENVDFFSAERTTDDTLSTSFTDGASITFTPSGASDWLILPYAQIDFGDTTNLVISRLDRSGEAASTVPEARYRVNSAALQGHLLLPYVVSLTEAANTFKEQAATTAGTAHIRLHSSVVAINLTKFRNYAFSYTEADAALSTTDYATQLQSVAITPDLAGDVWIGAYWGFDKNVVGNEAEFRVQLNEADQPAGQTTANYQFELVNDVNVELPLPLTTVTSLTATAHTIDLDASQSPGGTGTGQHRLLWAVTMELAIPSRYLIDDITYETALADGAQTTVAGATVSELGLTEVAVAQLRFNERAAVSDLIRTLELVRTRWTGA